MAKKRGKGIAAIWYSTGMSGGGDPSQVVVKLRPDGSVDLIIGSVDIGQGARTVMRQIAAQELGVSIDKVNVTTVDSDSSPLDTGTFASRVTHQTGNATLLAAREARQVLFEVAAAQLGVEVEKLEAKDDKIVVRGFPEQAIPIADVAGRATWDERRIIAGRGAYGWPVAQVDPDTGEGEPLHNMAYGATVAEVEVDTETGEVKVLKLVSAYDCGKAINPMLVEGQIDGGAAMGLGSALLEELHPYYPTLEHYPTGFFSYMIPTVKDLPELDAVIVEMGSDTGPYGAKGIGEMTANSQAPAIINAIHDAIGVWITDLPATSEKVLRAMEGLPPRG
ncbi:MAG TPA: molybdopterin cofactor-binding domain-containing protein [Anaerolineales bacterium]|nr:molybdopterin cofactor-binding domain-containing protein [Anaerolineales bacterium]